MALFEHFGANFDEQRNALRIGRCSCSNPAYARLDHLSQQKFDVYCEVKLTHRWNDQVELHEEIAHLGFPNGKRRTTKGRMAEEILQWFNWRNMSQIVPDLPANDTTLVRYNTDALTPNNAVQGVTHSTASYLIANASDSFQSHQSAEQTDGPVRLNEDEEDDESGVVIQLMPAGAAQSQESSRVSTVIHLVRRLCEQHGTKVAACVPILLSAWYLEDSAGFWSAAVTALQHYYIDLPPFVRVAANEMTMRLLESTLHSAFMRTAINGFRTYLPIAVSASVPPVVLLSDGESAFIKAYKQASDELDKSGC